MNSITRLLSLLLPLLTGVVISTAQSLEIPNVEYPTLPCELRNEQKVFVHAPLSTRQEIVKELRRHSNLIIAERPEEADYFLFFAYTPFVDGTVGGVTGEMSGAGARAEMTAVKFVHNGEKQARPRILFYWSGQKTSRSVPIPFNGLTPNGFTKPHSGKSAVEQLIGRFALWVITKKWPDTFYYDQYTSQLTISTGGKFETNGAKAFLKELKKARGDSYAVGCAKPLLPADNFPEVSPLLLDEPFVPATIPSRPLPVERPRVQLQNQSRPSNGGAQPRSFKRTKKGRSEDR